MKPVITICVTAILLLGVYGFVQGQGLVAYYPFENDANDASGNGNNGVVYGASFGQGAVGNAIHFDGVNDYVLINENTNLDGFNAFSISIWINPTTDLNVSSGRKDIIYKSRQYQQTHSYSLTYGDAPGKLIFAAHDQSNWFDAGVVEYQHDFPANQWYHIAITYDGISDMSMFVNGVDVGTQTNSGLSGQIWDTAEPMWLGMRHDNMFFFPGALDEFRLYDRALSLGEIQVLFAEIGHGQTLWCDGFEDYSSMPWSSVWHGSGNVEGIAIDNAIAHTGANSFRMFGLLGECWGAVATRPIQMDLPMEITFAVRNGSEPLSGCHPYRAALTLRTEGPDWWNCPCPMLLRFMPNGDIQLYGPDNSSRFSGFALEAWHEVKCRLSTPGDGFLHVGYWANSQYLGESVLPEEAWMTSGPAYLDISSQEGTAWFDDICVTQSSQQYYYSDLNISNLQISPETPVALESCQMTFSIENLGNTTWTSRDIVVEVIAIDLADVGSDGFWVWSLDSDQVRQISYVELDLPNLQPGEVIYRTVEFEFYVPDFINQVCCELQTTDPLIEVDDLNNEYKQCYTLNVDFNSSFWLNCFGTILTALIHTNLTNDDFETAASVFKGSFLQGGIPSTSSFKIPWQNGDYFVAIGEFWDYLWWYGAKLKAAFNLAGKKIPIISLFNAGFTEIRGQGCGGAIGHALLRFFEWLGQLFIQKMENDETDMSSIQLASPGQLNILTHSDAISIGCDGEIAGARESIYANEIEGIKSVSLPSDSIIGMSFVGCDSGSVDLTLSDERMESSSLGLVFEDVPVNQSTFGSIIWPQGDNLCYVLQLDFDGDNVVDTTLLGKDWTSQYASIYGYALTNNPGISNIPIFLFDSAYNIISSALTREDGYYIFGEVFYGDYTVEIQVPLGYTPSSEQSVPITLLGVDHEVNFTLQEGASGRYLDLWTWKTCLNDLRNNGPLPDIFTIADANLWADAIFEHYYSRGDGHAIQINNVTCTDDPARALSFDDLVRVMVDDNDPSVGHQTQIKLLTNILNVASGRMSQRAIVSTDGATASQGIQYFSHLYQTENRDSLVIAYRCLQYMYSKRMIPAGVIPLTIPNIMYRLETESEALPEEFSLSQSYPNPFNAQCIIDYALPNASHVRLEIFDILGRRVSTLVDEDKHAGFYQATWDAKEQPSGMYFYRIEAGEFTETKKMMLLK